MNDKDKQHRSEEFQELTSKIDRLEKIALLGAKNVLTIDDVALMEKPRDFDPFGHAGFAHLWLQYD